jgi:alpha-L-fucosidase 2
MNWRQMRKLIGLALSVAAVMCEVSRSQSSEYVLRYDKPAEHWSKDTFPLGSGRLGCMVFGGVSRERIQFNEESLWIGDESDTGAYQAFGDVFIDFSHGDATGYVRELDISRAVYSQRYMANGVTYERQYFASHPANVLVFRFSADRPGLYSGRVTLSDAHRAEVVREGETLVARGDLRGFVYGEKQRRGPDDKQYNVALKYEANVLVLHEGGQVAGDDHGGITFTKCDSITILLAAGTNFVQDRAQGWTGAPPHERVSKQLTDAAARSYTELLAEHCEDYGKLFNRMTLDLGKSPEGITKATTDQRLRRYNPDQPDHGIEELAFQYARYLLISTSRRDTLPANLQGKWNDSNQPVWRCDYHSDVNTQMNYWFADPANLAECFEPLAEWIYSIREVRRAATVDALGKPGWAMRAENGLFGGSTWLWSKGDASWLAQNLWDHYAFTRDKKYLRERVYPVQRDLCAFWLADLKELPDGRLVSPDGFSPEHGPHEDGVSYDQELIWDLFTNTIEAAEALDVDAEFRAELKDKRDRLVGPQIGRWGQLQEWMVDRDDPHDDHRHFSHLIAVHPGKQISPDQTPLLAKAAGVSLASRPDDSTGWSKAWKICIWARLHEANRAYSMLQQMFANDAGQGKSAEISDNLDKQSGGFVSNLLNTHPPFQIDGNFGYAAGVCEMLVQSHLNYIQLLPALPDQWPTGSVTGICARGGFELDIVWRNGRLTTATIRSKVGGTCGLLVDTPFSVTQDGEEVPLERVGNIVSFSTKATGQYVINPVK